MKTQPAASPRFAALLCAGLCALLSLFFGCERSDTGLDSEQKKPGKPETEIADVQDTVSLSPEHVRKAGIKVATAGPGKLATQLSLPAQIALDPDRVAHVISPVTGIVKTVRKRLGDHVKVGESLLVMESSDLAEAKSAYLARSKKLELAKLDLLRAKTVETNTLKLLGILKRMPKLEDLARIDALDTGEHGNQLISTYAEWVAFKRTLARQQKLAADKLTTSANLQAAQKGYQQASAAFLSIRDQAAYAARRLVEERVRVADMAALEQSVAARQIRILGLSQKQIDTVADEAVEELSRLELVSPIAGRIVWRDAVIGQLLKDDARPFVVANLDEVLGELTVYQQDLDRIRPGQAVSVTDDTKGTFDGLISHLTPSLREGTRSATAFVALSNKEGKLRPGAFVTGHVLVDRVEVSVIVPGTALQTVEGRTSVFVPVTGGFKAQAVTIGRSNATHTEILGGLPSGAAYVEKGAFLLKAELGKGGVEDDD